MKKLFLATVCGIAATFLTGAAMAENQEIIKKGSIGGFDGPEKIFTGTVKVTNIFPKKSWQPFSAGLVEFSPNARSAWHTHPAGQSLIVHSGKILTGTADGAAHIAEPGDAILCPPNVKHFHGAAGETAGAHIALTGYLGDQNVTWLEKVSDAEYAAALKKAGGK